MKNLVVLVMLFVICSCKKKANETPNNPVPSVAVDIIMYPNDPLNYPIQSIGGWMYVNGGLNGLIVYRKSNEEFIAIERTSTFLPENPAARVKVMSDNFSLRDTVSESRWRIIDGVVTKGPADWPLRLYGTTYDNNTLRIRN